MRKINLVWESEAHPEHEEQIIRELNDLLENDLEKPSDLIIHSIFVGDSMEDGPCVVVWGNEDDENDENFYCEYQEKIKWVSIGKTDEGQNIQILTDRSDKIDEIVEIINDEDTKFIANDPKRLN